MYACVVYLVSDKKLKMIQCVKRIILKVQNLQQKTKTDQI